MEELNKEINSVSFGRYSSFHIFCDETNDNPAEVIINGSYSTFVNCGSQYAIWHQFPGAIHHFLKDLDSGETYTSIDDELSISPSGNQGYDDYAKRECGKIVTENFSIILNDVYFISPPESPIKNFEIFCRYYNDPSNTIQVLNKSIFLKRF